MRLTSQEKLKKAVELYSLKMQQEFPSPEELANLPEPSSRFQKKMNRLLRRQKKSYYRLINTSLKRVAVAILVFLLLISCLMSVGAIRAPILNFFTKVYEEYTDVTLNHSQKEVPEKLHIEEMYVPAYLPEGFEKSMENVTDNYLYFEYINKEDKYVLFEQCSYEDPSISINTEGTTYEEILIFDTVGIYYDNIGIQSVLWYYDGYTFYLMTDMGKEEALKIARSIEVEK